MSQTNINREKKIRSILERSSNIDVQTLQKYIDKKLTKEELHEVEKQLLNSDFAAKAVEGFANADFKVNIAVSTNELNKEIKKYNKKRGFYKTNYRVFYAAASVALIFVFLFILIRGLQRNELNKQQAFGISTVESITLEERKNTKNEKLDLNQASNQEMEKEIDKKQDLKEKLDNQQKEKTNTNLALNEKEKQKEQNFSTSDIWVTKKEKVANENKSNEGIESTDSKVVVAASPSISSNRQMNLDSTIENTEQLADDDYNFFSNQNEGKKMARSKKTDKEILFDAMQSYENKKYTEAILLFDSYLITNPNDAQGLYFGGMAYYENNNYKKAIPLLEKFLTQKSSIIYQKNNQDAEWYLANSYLQANQKQKAKILLEKIANSNHTYSNQAKSLLKK